VAPPSEPPTVVEAQPAEGADSAATTAPEAAVPPKKAKRHASGKSAQLPGIGSIFRRMFAAHGSHSYYPNQ
jgi:hypothetical protein